MSLKRPLARALLPVLALAAALGGTPAAVPDQAPAPSPAPGPAYGPVPEPREGHFRELRQLTNGGENAEAYWSPDGQELIFQSQHPPFACDQIFRLRAPEPGQPVGAPALVSSGKGRTT